MMAQHSRHVSLEFVQEIAHDLNNQLNLIGGFTEMLDERYQLDENKRKENMSLVREAVARARALTQKLAQGESFSS